MSDETALEFVIAACLKEQGLDVNVYPDLNTGDNIWCIHINIRPELYLVVHDGDILYVTWLRTAKFFGSYRLSDPDCFTQLAIDVCGSARSLKPSQKSSRKRGSSTKSSPQCILPAV